MKPFHLYTLCAALLLASCSSKQEAGSTNLLAVSIHPLHDMVADVAGPDWEIVTLAGKSANPETFDPTVATVRKAAQARALFATGALGFESNITERIGSNTRVFNLAGEVDALSDTHGHAHHQHGSEPCIEIDPHIWNSLRNVSAMVRSIAAHMAEIDPANAARYRQRADSLVVVYQRADSALAATLRPGTAFMVSHPSLSYFARDYSLQQIGVGTEHKELSVHALAEAVERCRRSGAHIYLAENQADSLKAASFAREAGIQVVVVDPLSPDIVTSLTDVAKKIESAR